jgi:hypothetical protein
MAEKTNFELYRNTAVTLRFQLVTPEPAPGYVTGWLTQFAVKNSEQDANVVFEVTGNISNTAPNALQYGIFDVQLTANQTAMLNDGQHYDWSFRRTNSGYEDVLALGELRAFTTV